MEISESLLLLKRRVNKCYKEEERQKLDMLILISKNKNCSKRYLEKKIGVSATTILTWKKMYQNGGLDFLLIGKIQTVKISKEVEEKTLALMMRNRQFLPFTKIYEKINEEFPDVQYSNLIKHIRSSANCKTLYARFVEEKKQKPKKKYYTKKVK